MNLKIRELAEQAAINAAAKNFTGEKLEIRMPSEIWAREFAELIVKECTDFIDEFGSDLENGDVFGKSEKKLSEDLLAGHNGAALWRASDLLRQRFGVE